MTCSYLAVPSRGRAWLAVAGGFLVHLTIGTIYTFGNISPYVVSYIRTYTDPSLRYGTFTWIYACQAGLQGFAMFLGGHLGKKLHTRWTALLGAICVSAGTGLTGLAIQNSLLLTVFTYGIMVGMGTGIAYSVPLACGMKWLPQHKGMVNGIIVAGFGGGAFIFNQIQTAFINPENLSPDKPYETGSNEKYYSEGAAQALLQRVPQCFYLLAGCYATLTLIGCAMISDPYNDEEGVGLITKEGSHDSMNEVAVGDSAIPPHKVVTQSNSKQSAGMGILNLPPKEMLKKRLFYILWFIMLMNGMTAMLVSSLYKTYGQTFIVDDHFLALLGAFASVGNSMGRIAWGKLVDHIAFKTCMMFLCGALSILLSTLIFTPFGGKTMFFIWVFALFLFFSGTYVLLPTATAKTFGAEHVATNYGLIFTAQSVSSVLTAVLTSTLDSQLGFSGIFLLVAGMCVIGMFLTWIFNAKDTTGKDI